MRKVWKLTLVGIVPNQVSFSSDPALSSPIFVGDQWESLMQKVPDPLSGGGVRVYEWQAKGWSQSWLVLIGRLSCDAARANFRSRHAPGLGRNHLSCKREYSRLQLRWFRPKPGARRLLRFRIQNLLHQTLSLLADKDGTTDCWIRRKEKRDKENPNKSEFLNLLLCVLCTFRFQNHMFCRRRWTRECAGVMVRFIVKCIANQKIL